MAEKSRILFVDDEKRVLNAMRALFRRDYELFLANDGAEAVQMAADNEIDVIVADQRMPGMTGVEVLEKIKKQSPRTVRILLTGYADPTAIEGSINVGEVFRFLSKPCPPKLLRETLSLAIEASQTTAAAAPIERPPPAPAPDREEPAESAATQSSLDSASPAAQPPMPVLTTEAAEDNAPLPANALDQQAPELGAAKISTNDEASALPPASTGEVPVLTPSQSTSATGTVPVIQPPEAKKQPAHSHWETVTNVVLSEDQVSETQEQLAIPSLSTGHVGVVVFTIDADFASTAIKATATDRNTQIATTLVKVANIVKAKEAGVLITDFTTNKEILQKIVTALKQRLPELVTIVVSESRDSHDMINLINRGQVFRYLVKPVDIAKLRTEVNAAAVQHLFLTNNPESAKRHQVVVHAEDAASSETVNDFFGTGSNTADRPAKPGGAV